jgi:hypothetical protein
MQALIIFQLFRILLVKFKQISSLGLFLRNHPIAFPSTPEIKYIENKIYLEIFFYNIKLQIIKEYGNFMSI